MPAVVRGGRRRGATGGQARRGGGPRKMPAVPGQVSAVGRLDLSPRAVGAAFAAGAVLIVTVFLATGGAARIATAASEAVDGAMVAAGFGLKRVYIEGASPEAEPAIQQALQLSAGQPITRIDLEAVRQQAESVGWVESARVVRLLPDTLIVDVREHDRLAVWQDGRRAWVVDASGEIIPGADARRHPDLPLVRQRPRLASRLEALIRVDERRWDLRLKDGSTILLPASDEEAALIQLDAMDQRERLLDLGFSRVDLRTPEAVALRAGGAV